MSLKGPDALFGWWVPSSVQFQEGGGWYVQAGDASAPNKQMEKKLLTNLRASEKRALDTNHMALTILLSDHPLETPVHQQVQPITEAPDHLSVPCASVCRDGLDTRPRFLGLPPPTATPSNRKGKQKKMQPRGS